MPLMIFAVLLALNLGPMGPDAPAREPQLAAKGSTVALTFGAGAAIYFAVSHDSGRTFSAPVKVVQAGNVLLTHHRGPRIAISGNTIIISAITGKAASSDAHAAHGAGPDGDLFVWRSTDGGKTWSRAIRVNDVPTRLTKASTRWLPTPRAICLRPGSTIEPARARHFMERAPLTAAPLGRKTFWSINRLTEPFASAATHPRHSRLTENSW